MTFTGANNVRLNALVNSATNTEANVLVPTTVDPASKTPAFKSVLIRVEAMTPPAEEPGRRQPLALVGS